MLARIGGWCAEEFKRWLPDPFVFAVLLTIVTAVTAMVWVGASPVEVISGWYDGLWMLLAFGMQMVLILVTGYAIALSAPVAHLIDQLAARITRPGDGLSGGAGGRRSAGPRQLGVGGSDRGSRPRAGATGPRRPLPVSGGLRLPLVQRLGGRSLEFDPPSPQHSRELPDRGRSPFGHHPDVRDPGEPTQPGGVDHLPGGDADRDVVAPTAAGNDRDRRSPHRRHPA